MQSLKHIKYWIFDMDGTLTRAAHDFESIRTKLEIPPGTPILEAIEQMPPDKAREKTEHLHRLEMDIARRSVAQPHATTLLSTLQSTDCKTGILTRNAEDIAWVTLEAAGIADFFIPDCVIGRERCLPKPDPQGIERLMSAWNARPQEVVMVGDYLFDLQAGRNANVTTVHLDVHGQFDWPQLTDVPIQSLDQLLHHNT